MSYDFKKINELELVNEAPEGANVLIETEGATKRLPSTAINNGYSKEEVYNKTEADDKFLTKETIAKPDWNQNDENAADYVKNRTHWVEEGINLQWDGNKEGRDVCYFKSHTEIYLYKVSDKCFTAAELSNVTVVGSEREDAIDLWNKPNDLSENMGFSCVMLGVSRINTDLTPAVISVGAPVNFEGAFVAPSAGTYLADMSDPVWFGYWENEDGSPWAPVGYIKSVVGEETVHKLDKKFLPDDIGGDFVATFKRESESITCDKTFEECWYAIKNGTLSSKLFHDFVTVYNMQVTEISKAIYFAALSGNEARLITLRFIFDSDLDPDIWIHYFEDGTIASGASKLPEEN